MEWGKILRMMAVGAAILGCEAPEPRPKSIEVAAEHRSCAEDDLCGVVETSCQSMGCGCGVAVNERFLLEYQEKLAHCRGQESLESCSGACETPFAKCFKGACVLTDEPPAVVRRGTDVRALCERTGGTYTGCPDCPPSEICAACRPCTCPSSDKWTRGGCKRMVRIEPRDIRVEVRPKRVTATDELKVRIHNELRRRMRVKSVCGTPFYQARRKQDEWNIRYQIVPDGRCKTRSVVIAPGKSRPFVTDDIGLLAGPAGKLIEPGTYRFEVVYTDADDEFAYYDTVYSGEFDVTRSALANSE